MVANCRNNYSYICLTIELKKKIIKNSKMFKKHLLFLFICNIIKIYRSNYHFTTNLKIILQL